MLTLFISCYNVLYQVSFPFTSRKCPHSQHVVLKYSHSRLHTTTIVHSNGTFHICLSSSDQLNVSIMTVPASFTAPIKITKPHRQVPQTYPTFRGFHMEQNTAQIGIRRNFNNAPFTLRVLNLDDKVLMQEEP